MRKGGGGEETDAIVMRVRRVPFGREFRLSKRLWMGLGSALGWVRLGRLALILGGVAWMLAALPSVVLTAGYHPAAPDYLRYASYDYREGLEILSGLLQVVGAALIAAGLAGLYALLTIRLERRPKLATAGLALVALAVVCEVALLAQPRAGVAVYEPTGIEVLFPILALVGYVGGPLGVVLLGAATLRARGLGRWRALPLALGLLGSPLPQMLLFGLFPVGFSFGDLRNPLEGILLAALFQAPWALVGLGYVLLGRLMPRTGSKELVSREEENLSLARRLYEEAWGRGELRVLDELVVPHVVDHYHGGQRGRENLKRSVADLRVSFPDLRFDLEGQEAKEDRVTTRWTASGTDTGGVLWYPPTGRAATFSGTFTDRFEGGRIVEHRGESDTEGLLRRLGLPPVR